MNILVLSYLDDDQFLAELLLIEINRMRNNVVKGGRVVQNVKDYIDKELNKFVLANIIVVLFLAGQLDLLSDTKSISVFGISLANLGIVASPMYVYIFVLNYVYSPETKDKIVFWWGRMPGCTIFTDIRQGSIHDPRFTQETIIEKYKDIYNKITQYVYDGKIDKAHLYENESWYKIYSKYKNKGAVSDALCGQLLCRDMCVATFSMLMMLFVAWFLGYGYIFNYKCVIFLVVVYSISNAAARFRASRLVLNVIALDAGNDEDQSEGDSNE